MSASIGDISNQVSKSTEVVNDAVKKAEDAEQNARALENASTEIGSVVKLIKEIAEQKMKDLNAVDMDGAVAMISGSARAMGLEVVEG